MTERITFEKVRRTLICTVTDEGHPADTKVLVDGRWNGDATCDEHRIEAARWALENPS